MQAFRELSVSRPTWPQWKIAKVVPVASQARLSSVVQTGSGEPLTYFAPLTISDPLCLNRLVDRGRPVSEFDRDDGEAIDNDELKKEILREKDERDQEIFGMEGDMDEMEYEDDMADDDEKVHADGMEEEEKEIEVTYYSHKTSVQITSDVCSGTDETRMAPGQQDRSRSCGPSIPWH
jgi:hypothetical protein